MALDAGVLAENDFEKIIELIVRLLEPAQIPVPSYEDLSPWMARDKKNVSQSLSFSLPTGIGSCDWGLTGLDPAPALEWLKQTSFR